MPAEPGDAEPKAAETAGQLAETQARQNAQAAQLRALRAENEELREELELLRDDLGHVETQVQGLLPVQGRISGYLDMGLFYVTGTGAGHRADTGNVVFPEYEDISGTWVFMGDPLSTAVNSRGEPASTGDSRGIAFDPIGAKSAFLVNALNMQLFAGIGRDLSLTGLIDFVPRGRDVSEPDGVFLGDFVDVKLAYIEYAVPIERFVLHLYAGKLDSVLGYEYRIQEAPDRIGVTPSLLCRYLCGHPVGLKARARFLDEALIANLAVTNGSHFSESFPFADEVDSNRLKTVAARLSYRLPLDHELELGVSGALGAQDGQPRDDVYQHHLGVDARLVLGDVEVIAEYIKGKASGVTDTVPDAAPCDVAACIEYQGAYGAASYRVTGRLVPYGRVDWRDSLHRSGRSFVYIAELWRLTAGLRVELGTHVIIKAEYTLNRELGKIPQIPNDVMTSSLVVKY